MVGASGVSEEGGSGIPTGWSAVGPGSEYHSDNDLTRPGIVRCQKSRFRVILQGAEMFVDA
jgi:hypothetical protein